MHVLILGGTTEARELATALHARGVRVTTSLAGRVAAPMLPPGEVRVGGFGGPEGLRRWVAEHGVDRVVDATHPFAARIGHHAVAAGVPALRLQRPGWTQGPGDDWRWVDDLAAAARDVGRHGTRALLTTGRMDLAAFAHVGDVWFLVRAITPPDGPLPVQHELRLDRGPFTLEAELQLLREHAIDVVVTKDSGGGATAPKLEAARILGLPVLIVRRPARPPLPTVEDVDSALRRLSVRPAP